MESIAFCIAKNLAKALEFEENQEIIGCLFLSMDIMGFKYNGLDSSKYEILNGLNGTCGEFIDRFLHFLGFHKQKIGINDLLLQSHGSHLMIELDDFYLDYHPYFNKYHHLRHVVLTEISDHGCTIYDMEKYQLSLEILKPAVVDAFYINSNTEINLNIIDISEKLREYYENKNWRNHSNCVKAICLFRDDLKANISLLKEGDFESLYYFINKLGGPTQTRKFMNIGLGCLLDGLGSGSNQLNLLNNMMGSLAREWDILGNLFFRMSRKCHESMYERVFTRIDRIIEMEIQLENL